jgi:tRNA G18 (ribose-2'-O)-methylase SpoU
MALVEIDSLDDPRLEPYRDLKDTNRTRWFDRFVAEGEKLTQRLLASSCGVLSVLVDRTHLERLRPHLRDDIEVLIVADRLVPQIVGFNFHRGVLACGLRPENATLEQLRIGESLRDSLPVLEKPAYPGVRLVVLADVQDPENLGTIIRTGAAFGINGMLLGNACADPFSRRVLRTSMGAVWRIPLRRSPDLAHDLHRMRREFDVQLAATLLSDDATTLANFTPPARLALIMGNEGHGLSSELIDLCDHRLTLPMHPGTDSLNVSIAAGIFIYHLTR